MAQAKLGQLELQDLKHRLRLQEDRGDRFERRVAALGERIAELEQKLRSQENYEYKQRDKSS